MKVLHQLVIKQLIKNKKRTVMTLLGIILSTALITGVTLLAAGFQQAGYQAEVDQNGEWHAKITSIRYGELDDIGKQEFVEKTAYLEKENVTFKKDDNVMSAELISVPEKFIDQLKGSTDFYLYDGNLPKNQSEIASFISYNISIGNELELLNDQNQTKSYKVVGFGYSLDIDNSFFTTLDPKTLTDDSLVTVFIKSNQPKQIKEDLANLGIKLGISANKISLNDSLLRYLGISGYPSYYLTLFAIVAIIISLVSIGSIVVIYTSFSISLNERKKQFGALASVGATPKQIRNSVYFESFILGCIGIPIGLLSGFLGIKLTLTFLNNTARELIGEDFSIFVLKYIPIAALVISGLIVFLIVFLSAFFPARRASKSTPIENLRSNAGIKIPKKMSKTPKWITKIWGFEGEIALKNIKRNKARYRSIIFSLTISIVLFIGFSNFVSYGLVGANSYIAKDEIPDIDITQVQYPSDRSGIISGFNKIQTYVDSLPSVTTRVATTQKGLNWESEKNIFTKNYLNYDYTNMAQNDTDNYLGSVIGVDRKTFNLLLSELELNPKNYPESGELTGIALNLTNRFVNYEDGKILLTKPFDSKKLVDKDFKLFFSYINKYGTQIKEPVGDGDKIHVIGSIEEFTKKPELGNFLSLYNGWLIVPTDTLPLSKDFSADADDTYPYQESRVYSLNVSEKNSQLLEEQINQFLQENELNQDFSVVNWKKMYEDTEHYSQFESIMISVFAYGFIGLITLIGLTNIVNTVHTNMLLRKKEFAVLCSNGLTPKGLKKIIYLECAFYGIKSLLIAIAVSIPLCYLIYESYQQAFEFGFFMSIEPFVISIIAVFIILMLIAFSSSRKVRKGNLIDAIKNENI